MKTVISNSKNLVAEWVQQRIVGCSKWVDNFEAIGLMQNGELIAGVVFDNYVKNARVSIHCAGEGKRWLNRAFLKAVFNYAFVTANCNVAVNPVSTGNPESLRFTEHIGFTEACRIKGGCPDGDLVIFELQRANCRWLGA